MLLTVLFLCNLLSVSVVWGGGFLVSPVSRNYYAYGKRTRLVNQFPCGGDGFNTPLYNTLTGIVPTVVTKSFEGETASVLALNITFYNAQALTESDIRLYLCVDETDITKSNNCYMLKPDVAPPGVTIESDYFFVPDSKTLTSGTSYTLGVLYPFPFDKSDWYNKKEESICETEDQPCVIVFEWVLSTAETIYNCGDFYLDVSSLPNDTHTEGSTLSQAMEQLVDESGEGVPHGSCCYADLFEETKKLADFGQTCRTEDDDTQYRCGGGQCCSNTTGGFQCTPYSMGSNGSYLSYNWDYDSLSQERQSILAYSTEGVPMDMEIAQLFGCEVIETGTDDYRYRPCLGIPAYEELCRLCTLSNPSDCHSDGYRSFPEQYYRYYDQSSDSGNSNGSTEIIYKSKEVHRHHPTKVAIFVIFLVMAVVSFTSILMLTCFFIRDESMTKDVFVSYLRVSDDTKEKCEKCPVFGRMCAKRRKHQQALMMATLSIQELPQGWHEYTTDDGEAYYYNENTGATQWERPSGPI